MALRLYDLVIIAISFFASSNVIHGGRYDYDAASGGFKEKSKKQSFRVVVVDSPTPPKRSKADDPLWAKFIQLRNAIDNLDLWLSQFMSGVGDEIAQLDSEIAPTKDRLDFKLRREMLIQKHRELKREITRPQFSRRLRQKNPTDHALRELQSSHDRRLRLYDEIHDGALTRQINDEINKVVGFCAQLEIRNREEEEAMAALDASATIATLEEMRKRIDTDHVAILQLLKMRGAKEFGKSCQGNDVSRDDYDRICQNYVATIEQHQSNYEAIRAIIDAAQHEEVEPSDDEGRERLYEFGQHAAGIAAKVAVAPFAAIGYGAAATMRRSRAGYAGAKESYLAHKAEMRRRKDQHLAYRAYAENAFIDFIPGGLTEDEKDIYRRSFGKYAGNRYRRRDMDFVNAASRESAERLQQFRHIGELREGLRSIEIDGDISKSERRRIRRSAKRSLSTVHRRPELSNDQRYSFAAIKQQVRHEEIAKLQRAEESKQRREQRRASKLAGLEAHKRRLEQDRQRSQEIKEQKMARRQQRAREHALEQERLAHVYALYKTIKLELLRQYRQQSANEENADSIMQKLLTTEGSRKKNFSEAYVRVFDRTSLRRLVERINKPTYDEFWSTLSEQYRCKAEQHIERLKADRQKRANLAQNMEALELEVEEIRIKSDDERSAKETLLLLFFDEVSNKRRHRHSLNSVFGSDNLNGIITSHNTYDDFVEDLVKRYDAKVHAFLASRDQQLLLNSAKHGLSKKSTTVFRRAELSRLNEDLSEISSQFAIPHIATGKSARSINAASASASASAAQNRLDEALRELLAQQNDYEHLINAYATSVASKIDDEDDDDLSQEEAKDDDVIELDQAVLKQHFANWYVAFPKAFSTVIHVVDDCVVCAGRLDYDLEFSSESGVLIQKPKIGTHKLSGCGHMLCTACLREIEARAKKIKSKIAMGENMLSPYFCPLCQSKIASDELNEREFAIAYERSSVLHPPTSSAFYSAGSDHSADINFARKALDVWKERWRTIADNIVHYRPDNALAKASKRQKSDVKHFLNSDNSSMLSEFVDATDKEFLDREGNIEVELRERELADWYARLADFGITSFVGVEWIVSFTASTYKIGRATTARAHGLLSPNNFGYDLKHQSSEARSELKKICREQEKSLCDGGEVHLDLTNLPRTWQQFSERILATTTTAFSRVNDAVASCQAEVDKFILESNQGENLAETMALRIERENGSARKLMSSSLAQEYHKEREAIRAQFVADLRSRSVSVAKEDKSTGINLEQLTASYRAHVDRVDSKYALIHEFMKVYDRHLQELARTDLSDAAKRSFNRNRRVFQIASSRQVREEIYFLWKSRAEQNRERDKSELLAMPIATVEQMTAYEDRRAAMLAQAEQEWAKGISQIAKGGVVNSNWDREIAALERRVVDLLQREMAILESRINSTVYEEARTVFIALVGHLKSVMDEFSMNFARLIYGLQVELSQTSVERYQAVINDYVGEERIDSLWKINDTKSKFTELLTLPMKELRAVLAVENTVDIAARKLERLERSLAMIFPNENGEIAAAFFHFANKVKDNKALAFVHHATIATKIHEILDNEAEVIAPLVKAITDASEAMVKHDCQDFAGMLDAVSDLMWFISHVEYVHNMHGFNKTKGLLLRILRIKELKIKFGAQRLYRELVRDLSRTIGDKSAAPLKSEPTVAATSSSKTSSSYSGIPNMGNTCFANACLQALARVNEWGLRHPSQPVSSREEASKNVTAFREVTESLVSMIRRREMDGLRRSLMPFFDLVYKALPNFIGLQPGLQRDAQEFWIDMLDVLGIDKSDVNSPLNFGASTFIKPNKDSVQGEYVEPVPMHALMLPLEGKRTTLKAALTNWLQAHEFEREGFDGTMYTQALLHNPPDVMTIVINRFDGDNHKLNIPMSIDDVVIPFHRFDSAGGLNDVDNIAYRLVGGVYHSGKTTNSGHYYFIDHVTGIVFDDAETYQLALLDEKIIQKQSYVLFLQRMAP